MRKTLLLLITILLLTCPATVSADILIIANNSVPKTHLSKKEIKNIFDGKIAKWKDNKKIRIVVMKDTKIHKTFCRKYLRKTDMQFNAYWRNMVFTGMGTYPKTVKTSEKVMEYVTKTEGAIGYIDASTTIENVNIISVKK